MIPDAEIADRYQLGTMRERDFFSRVRPLLDGGGWMLTREGRITKRHPAANHATPWVSVHGCPVRRCERHHAVVFGRFGAIPRFCFDCWKVVVRPRTVLELFKLLETLGELPPAVPCKCGVELREYVPARYGGYVYALSPVEGRERLDQVRNLVADRIGPQIPVILKRGCTEFELRHGAPDRWEYPADWAAIEEWVDAVFDFPEPMNSQPEFLKTATVHGWLLHARLIGDETCGVFADGEPLPPPLPPRAGSDAAG